MGDFSFPRLPLRAGAREQIAALAPFPGRADGSLWGFNRREWVHGFYPEGTPPKPGKPYGEPADGAPEAPPPDAGYGADSALHTLWQPPAERRIYTLYTTATAVAGTVGPAWSSTPPIPFDYTILEAISNAVPSSFYSGSWNLIVGNGLSTNGSTLGNANGLVVFEQYGSRNVLASGIGEPFIGPVVSNTSDHTPVVLRGGSAVFRRGTSVALQILLESGIGIYGHSVTIVVEEAVPIPFLYTGQIHEWEATGRGGQRQRGSAGRQRQQTAALPNRFYLGPTREMLPRPAMTRPPVTT